MGDSTPRKQFMRQLKPKLPKKWQLIAYERNVDEITNPTLMYRQQSVQRLPAAPQGGYLTTATLELIVPETDMELAEDALDAALFVLLEILDSVQPNLWESNKKVLDAATNRLAYDVTVNFYTPKDLK